MERRRHTRVGVVFALQDEERGLRNALAESRSRLRHSDGYDVWRIGDAEALVIVGGVGRKRCIQAVRQLIEAGAQWIVSAGFAGGLDPVAAVGDVIAASRILSQADPSDVLESDPRLLPAVPPSGKFGFVIRHADLVTIDKVVCAASEKAAIYRSTGAAAMDMESHAAAQECRRAGVPFLAVRSISDAADEDLPGIIPVMTTTISAIRRLALLCSDPGVWYRLARLRAQARTAGDNLGEVLALMLLRLA